MIDMPMWVKNELKETSLHDGQVFVVALKVNNSVTGKTSWEIDKIRVFICEDGFSLYYAGTDDTYDAWEWSDFEYYIEVEEE